MNILWICTDQQRADTLGCYGNEWVNTPNIDRLAEEGMQFGQAFSQSPVCTPSRGAFLTGRYPRTCGCRQNGADIPEHEVLVTRMLADEGYECGLSGKLHLSACNPDHIGPGGSERRIHDGYTDFHWSHHSATMAKTKNEYHEWLQEQGLDFIQTPFEGSNVVSTSMTRESSQAGWCADKAIEFIDARAEDGRPWLYSVNMFDPHHAFDPPEEFLERYLDRLDEIPLPNYVPGELDDKPLWQRFDHERGGYGDVLPEFKWSELSDREHRLIRAAYWAMCDLIDVHVGRMLAALDAADQRKNTLVIFCSDHGELLGDHGIYLKGPFFYDCCVRVPLILNLPGVISPGKSNALVELLDLPQTILDAAGMTAHPGMMGKSLWPLISGQQSSEHHRDDIYCESYNACHGHSGESEQPAMATMIRTSDLKLVVAHGHGSGEFYDLIEDPEETNNLWYDERYTSRRMEMMGRMIDRIAYTVDPLPERHAVW